MNEKACKEMLKQKEPVLMMEDRAAVGEPTKDGFLDAKARKEFLACKQKEIIKQGGSKMKKDKVEVKKEEEKVVVKKKQKEVEVS